MVERKRHFAKALTYRVFGSAVTAGTAYLITGSPGVSATAGIADSVVKVGLYYVHERVWYHVRWGVRRDATPPDERKGRQ